jgi:hypothetical protein
MHLRYQKIRRAFGRSSHNKCQKVVRNPNEVEPQLVRGMQRMRHRRTAAPRHHDSAASGNLAIHNDWHFEKLVRK